MKRKSLLALFLGIAALYLVFVGIVYRSIDSDHGTPAIKWLTKCSCDVVPAAAHTIEVQTLQAQHPSTCKSAPQPAENASHTSMFDVLEDMHISYPRYIHTHSGWIQEFKVQPEQRVWSADYKLTVFVVLHSHNDPGWLRTADSYYRTDAAAVLHRALEFLERKPSLRFVWAEVVYLARWFSEATPEQQERMQKLVSSGRLELVTGGWVMSDEAVVHYEAMLDQLTQGHQWLQQHLNYTVKHGWAIDPFGHSSTMAYLLQRSGLKAMLIQRVHYAVKQHLSYRKQLEYYWRQAWDVTGESSIFCHMMPFTYYSIPYSCGPDTEVCCQFDFTSSKCWNWGEYEKASEITAENIEEKSWLIVQQYRKKAQAFRHNILLVPHGDDFRYDSDYEWETQTSNLEKLFDHINAHPSMHVQVQFGTLADYFQAVAELGHEAAFPTVSGDMFTYNDRADQYWSGFFTSRPFLKRMARVLQYHLRSAEILFTLAASWSARQGRQSVLSILQDCYPRLLQARATQGLLQHHDAITGTARAKVVVDYLEKLQQALHDAGQVIEKAVSASFKLQPGTTSRQPLPSVRLLEKQKLHNRDLEMETLQTNSDNMTVLLFNPLTTARQAVVHVQVSHHRFRVYTSEGGVVACQVLPVFKRFGLSTSEYQIHFSVALAGLSTTQYILSTIAEGSSACPLSAIRVNKKLPNPAVHPVFKVNVRGTENIAIENERMKLFFCSCSGLLQAMRLKRSGRVLLTSARLVTYGTGSVNPWRDRSGAYVFLPGHDAHELEWDSFHVVVVEGPLVSQVLTSQHAVQQTITLHNVTGAQAEAVFVDNTIDWKRDNSELAMRIVSGVRNKQQQYFTDLNGFQMHKRRTMSKMTLQGNFYPMTSAMYAEDDDVRLTLLSAQSHGVASLRQGWLEVMLDRRLNQDDWRGLGEGVTDNVPVRSRFVLLLETRYPTTTHAQPRTYGMLSQVALSLSNSLNNPPLLMLTNAPLLKPAPSPVTPAWPCDVTLVNMRSTGVQSGFLLVLHRWAADCNFASSVHNCPVLSDRTRLKDLFSDSLVTQAEEVTLSGGRKTTSDTASPHSFISPMQIKTFNVSYPSV